MKIRGVFQSSSSWMETSQLRMWKLRQLVRPIGIPFVFALSCDDELDHCHFVSKSATTRTTTTSCTTITTTANSRRNTAIRSQPTCNGHQSVLFAPTSSISLMDAATGRRQEQQQQQLRWSSSSSSSSSNSTKDSRSSSFASSSFLFGSASSLWSDLRQKAASAITSSLSENEREALMAKYNAPPPNLVDDVEKEKDVLLPDSTTNDANNTAIVSMDSETLTKTIAEAMAEARAKEAASQEEHWQKKMDEHERKMEQAAKDRIDLERRQLQFEQWKLDLEQAKYKQQQQQQQNQEQQQQVQSSESSQEEEEDETVTATVIPVVDDETSSSRRRRIVEQPTVVHPLLGPELAVLGSKRLYLVSVDTLVHLPVWKKQRTYRHDRAKVMAKDKAKSLHLGIPGVICLFEDENGELSVLDGQHRVGMMKLLAEKQEEGRAKKVGNDSEQGQGGGDDDDGEIDLSKILVEVFSATTEERESTEKFATDLFVEINKAEPLKLVDMPGVAKESDRRIITQAAEKLKHAYPKMFSASQKCRVPHVNIDNLRDNLFAADVLQKHGLKSPTQLMSWLLEQNKAQGEKYKSGDRDSRASSTALEKAEMHEFYLGLDSNWLYN